MKQLCVILCIFSMLKLVAPAPADGFVFPNDARQRKKFEPVITPPVLPVLEHLERDPSTLLPNESIAAPRFAPNRNRGNTRPKFGGGFSVQPSNGGFTGSISSSASGGGASQSASQSFSFGFNQGFSASQSASQSASFSGFGNGFSGSQSSSQAASFAGSSASAAASSSAAFSGGSQTGSQSASSAFGFNSLNDFQPPPSDIGYDNVFDVRHRGAPNFPFPFLNGRSKGVGAAAFRTSKQKPSGGDDWISVLVSDLKI